ncbi:hypothetical protein UUU_41050 [Klebsiella pneumoniae subsp. pneumoniae DSM 30104 = JCM 1662 = NBRC 14940]|nr:hypothetical protein UUU_41050 [Klebsiella pneumoniae subsp. pneumoniae DSM 30104 = JCM 1662 = NBRC 14940]
MTGLSQYRISLSFSSITLFHTAIERIHKRAPARKNNIQSPLRRFVRDSPVQ